MAGALYQPARPSTTVCKSVYICLYYLFFGCFFVTLSVTLILKIGFLGWGVPFSWAHANGRSAGPKAVVFGHKKSPKKGLFYWVYGSFLVPFCTP
ncbi:hypothetical protein CCAN11_2230011 [Capnocytophaga canimorsus]|uniref:Uncharacterized protein n=1 Tax=Capnocytophaga canimorsus TaxID=28188 RepID=A0A0B7IK75_9FLAO|nr:hypothetical protein CCAN11_2230011 [Capnocytophaga canimorsus]